MRSNWSPYLTLLSFVVVGCTENPGLPQSCTPGTGRFAAIFPASSILKDHQLLKTDVVCQKCEKNIIQLHDHPKRLVFLFQKVKKHQSVKISMSFRRWTFVPRKRVTRTFKAYLRSIGDVTHRFLEGNPHLDSSQNVSHRLTLSKKLNHFI